MCLYSFDKPIKSLYFRSLVVSVLFASFHFENRSSSEDDRDTQNVVTSEVSDLSAENSGKFLQNQLETVTDITVIVHSRH